MARDIIEIDREKCNGCGLCTTACAEGALAIDKDHKAVLVKEIFCDGLGACLDVCPVGALKIVKRESPAYDAKAVEVHLDSMRGACGSGAMGGGCPGSASSELQQWPIQLHLISPQAPYFQECDLLVAADCTAFSLGCFHAQLLKGKRLVIACPKLDDGQGYVEKLTELIRNNRLSSITVAIMEVPCCGGLLRMVQQAVQQSGISIPIRRVTVGIEGDLKTDEGQASQ